MDGQGIEEESVRDCMGLVDVKKICQLIVVKCSP